MNFSKYQASHNDFILINAIDSDEVKDKSEFAIDHCKRRSSIGADGVIWALQGAQKTDVGMRIFNPDGSEAEMCGNGVRCLVKFLLDKNVTSKTHTVVDTISGVVEADVVENEVRRGVVRVNMGRPKINRADIPVKGDPSLFFIDEPIDLGDNEVRATSLNTGVPQTVIFSDLSEQDALSIGRKIRNHPIFPKGTNVNFVKVIGESQLQVRTYERGVETFTRSCGTGVVASAAAAFLNRYIKSNKMTIKTSGGDFDVELLIKDTMIQQISMTGDVSWVFDGSLAF